MVNWRSGQIWHKKVRRVRFSEDSKRVFSASDRGPAMRNCLGIAANVKIVARFFFCPLTLALPKGEGTCNRPE
jgi:hypothetical protein